MDEQRLPRYFMLAYRVGQVLHVQPAVIIRKLRCHFLIYNTPAGYTADNTPVFSPFAFSADSDFVAACNEMLKDGAVIRQMYEEQRFDKQLSRILAMRRCHFTRSANMR